MLFILIAAFVLGSAVAQPLGLASIGWGQSRTQLAASMPDLELVSGGQTRADGLVYGARTTAKLPNGSLEMRFFFAPLSEGLAGFSMSPEPKTLCPSLLLEWRQMFGKGVNISTIPELEDWQFSDLRGNAEWHFHVYNDLGRSEQAFCVMNAKPLVGTLNAH